MDDSLVFSSGLLRQVAKAIDALSPEERLSLLRGDAALRVIAEPISKSRNRETKQSDEVDVSAIRIRLDSCHTREEAAIVLDELALSKSSLLRLSKGLDLPSQRDDSVSKLIDRIIDSTVGFRLRSRAIQGRGESDVEKSARPVGQADLSCASELL